MTADLATALPDSEWVHFDDAAAELKVSRATLGRYARAGKVLRLYHGGRVWTTRTSINAYKASEAKKAEERRKAIERAASKTRRRS